VKEELHTESRGDNKALRDGEKEERGLVESDEGTGKRLVFSP
jgi:hypothetical protein